MLDTDRMAPIFDFNYFHYKYTTGPAVEMEGRDRSDLNLPGKQKDVILDVLKSTKGSKTRIVLLLFNAGPLNVTFADVSPQIDVIMECFFPGQGTGEAIKNVLTNTGKFSSLAGRLPNTWPMFETQLPPMVNYSMQGRTYRYLETQPLYPFGYGLSYTKFSYADMKFDIQIEAKQNLSVILTLINIGEVDSDEVIQCYISWEDQTLPVPIRQLAYFNRVYLLANQKIMHQFSISWERMAFWLNGQWVIKAGLMNLYCGGQQPFQKKSAPSNILSGQFTIVNSVVMRTL